MNEPSFKIILNGMNNTQPPNLHCWTMDPNIQSSNFRNLFSTAGTTEHDEMNQKGSSSHTTDDYNSSSTFKPPFLLFPNYPEDEDYFATPIIQKKIIKRNRQLEEEQQKQQQQHQNEDDYIYVDIIGSIDLTEEE